jgi:hypothetical protein
MKLVIPVTHILAHITVWVKFTPFALLKALAISPVYQLPAYQKIVAVLKQSNYVPCCIKLLDSPSFLPPEYGIVCCIFSVGKYRDKLFPLFCRLRIALLTRCIIRESCPFIFQIISVLFSVQVTDLL